VASKFYSERNLRFLLYEVFDVVSLTKLDSYKDHNKKMFDMVLDAAAKLAKKLLFPIFEEMDRNQPELVDGTVKVHPQVRKILKEFGEGGWITISKKIEHGGEQLPLMISDSCNYIFSAANYSAAVFPGLCTGVSHLIESFGNDELNQLYVPKMHSGEWQGTMALTEPQAGSSLADIETSAELTNEGYYLIKGQKIFISAGDHDAAGNIVHLMLAKIKGAPPGIKGISLFVVPKLRPDGEDKLVPNDVITSGIYHKMGYRGAPIAQLSIGDQENCRGYLVGEAHRGVFYMFQMMNEARLNVGLAATAISSAAYYATLEYCKERKQGRKVGQKDPLQPQIPIIEHADIRRTLLFQRSINEGSHALLLQCCKYADLQNALEGEEKEKYSLLLDLLTPVAKTYPSEMGIQAISQGLQCLGGSGFCDDYPLEQYYRDIRIHPIHEGTTVMHGMDILGRKVIMKNGRALELFIDEVAFTMSLAAEKSELEIPANQLKEALKLLKEVTDYLLGLAATKDPEWFLADSVLYLEQFGITAIAWQWLNQAIVAHKALDGSCSKKETDFYQGKLHTMRYYFAYELPKIKVLGERLKNSDGLTITMNSDYFND